MSNSVPEHTYVHTGPIRSVAVCTKLFRKLPINTQRRRKHSRHQWGYICLHVNCSSACLCNGAEHIHGQRSPLFPVNFGETDSDYLTVFLLHIRCAACSLRFKHEGGIPNTAAPLPCVSTVHACLGTIVCTPPCGLCLGTHEPCPRPPFQVGARAWHSCLDFGVKHVKVCARAPGVKTSLNDEGR